LSVRQCRNVRLVFIHYTGQMQLREEQRAMQVDGSDMFGQYK